MWTLTDQSNPRVCRLVFRIFLLQNKQDFSQHKKSQTSLKFTVTVLIILYWVYTASVHSAKDRRGYVLERMFTKFSEITQCNGHYAVQGHSRSHILVPIESSYTTSYYLSILTYLPVLHPFQIMAHYRSNFLAWGDPLIPCQYRH